ncbi:CocE/NonD family hydrolase [Paraflavitalea sp. CAU 1676]|uniref:CocE/NonD family hydrolase n=1 Tax=Paraflavitalea sp. CAU 1676 TaxID=3032598 RepID=UPI0023DA6082|nr:CocE/NonD family hydrolase [Paraflavitalea sp. CAU 1676]MDF2193389.1 CocE/NonD family hydrolase [Paraflavitalea sp. CAU 1676]
MRKLFLFLSNCFIIFWSQAQLSPQTAQDSAWVRDNYTKQEFYIPMRDGVKLFTSVYVPKDATEKHPILMTRTPYSCAPYGAGNYAPRLWISHFRHYARERYIFVTQDVRGRWMSEGEFVDVRPFNPNKQGKDIDEASDTYDAIDWLVKNLPGNNGHVGVMGISYPGFYSTMAALSAHPALKAVSPQAPVTDWFMGDDFHHNGALFLMDGFSFYAGGFGYPRPKPTTVGPQTALTLPRNDNYETYLRVGALKNFMKLTGDSLQFWKDLYAHPNLDDWWKARNPRNFVGDIKPAMLTVGGLFDAEDCFGAWRLYEAIEKKNPSTAFNKLVMGPWFHGQWSSLDGTKLGNVRFGDNTSHWYQNNIELPFFNYFLKGKGDISKLAEATVFFSGANEWKQLPQWPPAGKTDKALYLQPDGRLGWDKPAGKNSFSEYISDPAKPVPYTEDVHFGRTREYMTDDQRFAARRTDVLTFQTDVLAEDLTLGGTLVADLLTSISGTDADFVVKLIDVFPDNFTYPGAAQAVGRNGGGDYPMGGYQMLVRGEVMRGRFRNSFEKPEAFKPNKVERVKYELPDVAHTFQKGHRVMIQIQSSWFPLVDRNPQQFVNIYEANDSDFKKATIRIFHDGANSSSILLPVLGK